MIPTSGQPFVRLVAVSKSYGSGPSQLPVLNQVELALPQGQTTSLVGRSGSGKSTLLSVIAGLMRPDSGHVYIGGLQMDQMDDDARASLRADLPDVCGTGGLVVDRKVKSFWIVNVDRHDFSRTASFHLKRPEPVEGADVEAPAAAEGWRPRDEPGDRSGVDPTGRRRPVRKIDRVIPGSRASWHAVGS